MSTHANALAVMAKAPVAGQVKTRLVPPLTEERAAEFYRALLLDQLENLSGIAFADLYLAYTPSEAAAWARSVIPPGFHSFPQRGNDLGERMNAIFTELWDRGHRNVVLIGSDLPALPLSYLKTAFDLLATQRAVLGPSRDGGYYLVGLNRPTPEIFQNMTWSHNQVLGQTLARLNDHKIKVELLPEWFDVDTAADLKSLGALNPSGRRALTRTLALLQTLRVVD
jgi:uncharacterized protein